MVGDMALRLGWLFDYRLFHRSLRSYGRRLSYLIPCHQSCIFRYLGVSVARIQSRCHGLYLVWRTILDRRGMRLYYAPCHLSQHRQLAQWYSRIRNRYEIVSLFLPVLVFLVTGHLVPRLSDPTLVHGEILYRARCWGFIHGVGYCQSGRSWSDCSPTLHCSWERQSLGSDRCHHGLHFKFRNIDCQRSGFCQICKETTRCTLVSVVYNSNRFCPDIVHRCHRFKFFQHHLRTTNLGEFIVETLC